MVLASVTEFFFVGSSFLSIFLVNGAVLELSSMSLQTTIFYNHSNAHTETLWIYCLFAIIWEEEHN